MPARLIVSAPAVSVDPLPAMQLPAADEPTAPLIASSPAPTPSSSPTDVTRTLGTELAVQCPERTAPRYPPLAKRQREQGEVQLRVELDERGRIDSVRIVSSSGSPRLD
jgi:protein TonB